MSALLPVLFLMLPAEDGARKTLQKGENIGCNH